MPHASASEGRDRGEVKRIKRSAGNTRWRLNAICSDLIVAYKNVEKTATEVVLQCWEHMINCHGAVQVNQPVGGEIHCNSVLRQERAYDYFNSVLKVVV